jgi:hypothetical protein
MSDEQPITDELAAWFHEAVGVADCWYAASAPGVLMRRGSIEGVCSIVIGFSGDMPQEVSGVLRDLAQKLNVNAPAGNTYRDGARSLLDIHRELLKRYPTIPKWARRY